MTKCFESGNPALKSWEKCIKNKRTKSYKTKRGTIIQSKKDLKWRLLWVIYSRKGAKV